MTKTYLIYFRFHILNIKKKHLKFIIHTCMLVFKCHVSEYVYIVFLKIQLRAERNHFVQTPTNEKKTPTNGKTQRIQYVKSCFSPKTY